MGIITKIFVTFLLILILFLINYCLSYRSTIMLLLVFVFSIVTEYLLSGKYYQRLLYMVPASVLVYLLFMDHWIIMIAGPIEIGVAGMMLIGFMVGMWLGNRRDARKFCGHDTGKTA